MDEFRYEMAPPAALRNKTTTLKDKSKPKTEVPNIMLAFYFTILFVFGHDFGFVKSLKKKFRPLVKFVSACIALVSVSILVTTTESQTLPTIIWGSLGVAQFILHYFILQFSKYTAYDLMNDFHSMDTDIMSAPKNKLGIIVIIVYSIVMSLIKMILCSLYCVANEAGCRKHMIPGYIICIPVVGCDVVSVTQVFTYYYVYNSVTILKNSLSKTTTDLKAVREYYVSIANYFDAIKPFQGRIILTDLIITSPKLMLTCLFLIRCIKENIFPGWIMHVVNAGFAIHMLVKIFAPPIVAEMINSEVDAVELKLHSQLLTERDEKQKQDIADLLRYMEARRLQQTVCRFIPVDIRLPFSLLSVWVTYIIVLIQFTHIID